MPTPSDTQEPGIPVHGTTHEENIDSTNDGDQDEVNVVANTGDSDRSTKNLDLVTLENAPLPCKKEIFGKIFQKYKEHVKAKCSTGERSDSTLIHLDPVFEFRKNPRKFLGSCYRESLNYHTEDPEWLESLERLEQLVKRPPGLPRSEDKERQKMFQRSFQRPLVFSATLLGCTEEFLRGCMVVEHAFVESENFDIIWREMALERGLSKEGIEKVRSLRGDEALTRKHFLGLWDEGEEVIALDDMSRDVLEHTTGGLTFASLLQDVNSGKAFRKKVQNDSHTE